MRTLIIVAGIAFAGCTDRPTPTAVARLAGSVGISESTSVSGRHIVVFAAERVPGDFRGRVERLGGTVERSLDSIGVGIVDGLPEGAGAQLAADPDVRAVETDVAFQIGAGEDILAGESLEIAAAATAATTAPASPWAASLYPRQWNMRAISADKAWQAGYLGSPDVKVVILDTGIDYMHPELQGLVDLTLSRSFVPAEDTVVDRLYPGRNHVTDLFWHGTGMAATVASNAKLLAGVTQHVTLVGLKVADRFGSHDMSAVLAAVVYAADLGADVMNVSGGTGQLDKSENPGLIAAYLRAFNYAWRKGVLVVGVAGNDTLDHDHNRDLVGLPCEAPNALCVSATGPTAAQTVSGPWTDVDAPALYTGYGRSVVSVAAPGGQRFTNTRVWAPCLTTPSSTTPAACRPPACPNPSAGTCLIQGIGTSLSAPHTSGLAALLVQQLGHGNKARIRQRILQSADDLGEPGVDPYYGHGRINVARALGLVQ